METFDKNFRDEYPTKCSQYILSKHDCNEKPTKIWTCLRGLDNLHKYCKRKNNTACIKIMSNDYPT